MIGTRAEGRPVLSIGVAREPCDRVVFSTSDVVLGEFRCPVSYAGFRDAGRINHHVVAFPRSGVWIEREDAPRFVADPGLATIYNPGQPYVREPISPDGDVSDWLGISERLARDAVLRFSPADAGRARPFRQAFAPARHDVYLAQRSLFRHVASGNADAMHVEERVFELVTSVLRAAYQRPTVSSTPPRRGRAGRDLVEEAKAAMLATLFDNLSVCDIARRIEVSPFHLCRTFRRLTGLTLHAYRRDMRLRAALGLADGYRGRLSQLALRSGFSSHSHFTTAYRRCFGRSPSATLA